MLIAKHLFSCLSLSLWFLANCTRRLDSNNLTEHDDDIYCRSCYGKLFGPKGYGYGGGAGVLSMDTADGSQATSNIPATAQAFIAPKLSSSSSSSIITIGKSQGSSSYLRTLNNNQADICPRCKKAVYMAEKMMGGGSVRWWCYWLFLACHLVRRQHALPADLHFLLASSFPHKIIPINDSFLSPSLCLSWIFRRGIKLLALPAKSVTSGWNPPLYVKGITKFTVEVSDKL